MGGGRAFVRGFRKLAICALTLSALAPWPALTADGPQRGGTIVAAVAADPGHLNPAITTAGPVHAIAASIHNGLVTLDRNGVPQPDLAEGWTTSSDGLSVTFRLRAGVKWHDGAPFSSADVKFTLEQVLFRLHARARAGLAPAVAAVETPDALTVVFRLKRPHPALLRQLDVTEAPILPRHIFDGADVATHPRNQSPIGTGPFRVESYRRDEQVVLTRNPDYFKSGLPLLDRLVFRIIPDATTQANALIGGEVDVLPRVSAMDARRLAGHAVRVSTMSTAPGGSNCVMTLAFNLDRPALASLSARRAFAAAIDRERLLQVAAQGLGRVAQAPIASGIGFAHLPGALDAAARGKPDALFDEAGLTRGANGHRAAFSLLLFPGFVRYAEAIQQNLAPFGVSLTVRAMDAAAFAPAVFARRDFDLALISYCNGTDPEIGVRRMVHSSQIGPTPFSNAAGFHDADVDRLFDEAAASTDESRRSEAYRSAQRRLAMLLPYWWLVETDFAAAWHSAIEDLEPGAPRFADTAWRRR